MPDEPATPNELTPEELDILANSPADAPVQLGDDDGASEDEPGEQV